MRKRAIVLLFILPHCLCSAHALPTTAEAREAVLHWADSLHSFSGTYVTEDAFFGDEARPGYKQRITYHFQAPNEYMEASYLVPSKAEAFSYATFDGKYSLIIKDEKHKYPGATLNSAGTFKPPPGAYMLPVELFGAWFGTPLNERFEGGTENVYEEDGRVLYCFRCGKGDFNFDVWLDPQLHVQQFDVMNWFDLNAEELRDLDNMDPVRAALCEFSLEFLQTASLNGIVFPIKAIRRYYAADKTQAHELMNRLRNHEITHAEAMRQTLFDIPRHVSRTTTFTANPDDIVVNAPVADDAFKLTMTPGLNGWDVDANQPFSVPPAFWDQVEDRVTGTLAYWESSVASAASSGVSLLSNYNPF